MSGVSLYLYALLPRSSSGLELCGVAGEPIEVRQLAGLAIAVGQMRAAPSATARTLRLHNEVVLRLSQATCGALPFRFGQLAGSERAITEQLEGATDRIRAALEHVAGCSQMTLRLYAGEHEGERSVAGQGGGGDDPALGPGTRYLRARRAPVPQVEALRGPLEALVRDERIERHDTPPLRASVYHLVPNHRLPSYRCAVGEVSGRLRGARVTTSGPWPPYSFAEVLA